MAIEEIEKPATMEDIRNEVAKIKAVLAEAVDDGIRSALRAVKQGRYAAEDAIDDARYVLRKRPFEAVGIVFLAGALTGCFAAWLAMRGRKEEKG